MRWRVVTGSGLVLIGAIAGFLVRGGGGDFGRRDSSERDGRGGNSEVAALSRLASDFPQDIGPRRYIRVIRDPSSQKVRALQTSVVEFRAPPQSKLAPLLGKEGSVTLIGAVHLGERRYYNELNREFRNYSKVLYELVAPRGVRPKPEQGANGSLFATFQRLLTDYFGMVHQIDAIDYSPRHFVHADLSPEEIVAEGKRRGETMMSLGLGVLGDMFRAYGEMKQLSASNPTASQTFQETGPKAMLAQLAEVMDRTNGQGLGGTLEPYIIDIRNEEALRVLTKEVIGGARRVAIFYGAAHLPKFEQSLRQRFGLVPVREGWLTAWELG